MLGAVVGDIIGSVYERRATKSTDFPLFSGASQVTDDSVLTVAQADQLLHGRDWARTLKEWTRLFPNAGYGGTYVQWAMTDASKPYGSWGNGSAMRVSPVGWAFDDLETVLAEAARSAAVTHDHPEGIKGAQATAAAVFLARTGASKEELRGAIAARFGYDLDRTVEEIRPDYRFDVSCQGSVPEALLCFLDAEGYEGAVRNAVSLGGDADTQAAIAGAVAEAAHGGVPEALREEAVPRIPEPMLEMLREFYARFAPGLPAP